jgi:hypothetical protein
MGLPCAAPLQMGLAHVHIGGAANLPQRTEPRRSAASKPAAAFGRGLCLPSLCVYLWIDLSIYLPI